MLKAFNTELFCEFNCTPTTHTHTHTHTHTVSWVYSAHFRGQAGETWGLVWEWNLIKTWLSSLTEFHYRPALEIQSSVTVLLPLTPASVPISLRNKDKWSEGAQLIHFCQTLCIQALSVYSQHTHTHKGIVKWKHSLGQVGQKKITYAHKIYVFIFLLIHSIHSPNRLSSVGMWVPLK